MNEILKTVVPHVADHRGAFGFKGQTLAYPITLTATYKDLTPVTVQVPFPPQGIVPMELRFANPLPQVTRITTWQQGNEVQSITSGEPVTFVAEFNNPSGLTLDPHWIAEFNGQKQLSTAVSPTFTFVQPAGPAGPGLGDPLDSGSVIIRFYPACFPPEIKTLTPVEILPNALTPCWSGTACIWNPDSPDDLASAHPATITLTRNLGLPLATSTSQDNGYFEMGTSPTAYPPYRLKVEKEGYAPFIWPFEHRLPREADFCVYPLGAAWISLETLAGTPLTYGVGVTLAIPTGPTPSVLDPISGFRQNETTGYFERTGYGGTNANRVSSDLYEIPLESDGLYVVGHHTTDLNELIYTCRRTDASAAQ